MVGIDLAKEILREEDCCSFAMKRSCVWKTHDLQGRSRGNNIQQYEWK